MVHAKTGKPVHVQCLPQGAYLGNLEYGAQSNNNTQFIDEKSKFKFVDDLTTLEAINLLLVGMASYFSKHRVPSDVHKSNLIIPSENLKSQMYLDKLQDWTKNQKIILNEEKTKSMIFNFTKNKSFPHSSHLMEKKIESVTEMKILGTIITDDLKWGKNTKFLIKRAYARMELYAK